MTAPRLTRRGSLGWLGAIAVIPAFPRPRRVFDVRSFGAVGDGRTLDTRAIQAAIDAAARVGGGARVLVGGRRRYLTSPVELRGGIDFHVERGSRLLVSTRPEDYADARLGVLHARGADDLTISGSGVIDGRSHAFMDRYDAENEWWIPKPFRPRLLVLEACRNLVVRDIAILRAPSWTVHLLGCRQVLIDAISIANQLDVPNCDGIDPDHCQDVEIRNCRIVCGDDAIVIKATAGNERYGPSRNITVRDCMLETQDSGLKIGTETVQDVHDILFERCTIVRACRGLCIQLRDQGSVYNVTFRNIRFVAQYFSAPWWGRGEAISFTAFPRTPETRLGVIHHVTVEDVVGRAENSVRIEGFGASRIHDVAFTNVAVTLDRWTKYPGGEFDNRPTKVAEPIERHGTPGFHVRTADRVTLRNCSVRWGSRRPDYFTHALEASDVSALAHPGFVGDAASPGRDAAIHIGAG